jgi:hypothetical protein
LTLNAQNKVSALKPEGWELKGKEILLAHTIALLLNNLK